MLAEPIPLNHSFEARIGVEVKGELWPCIEMPRSVDFFGTGKAVKVEGTLDGQEFAGTFLPTGTGGHMLSLNQKIRKQIGKGMGDKVKVALTSRLS